jgi:tetratricopeptide (TPR) repeat protein
VLEKLGLINRALIMYEACSLYAVKSKEYYGAYACLYLGDLYAKDNNIESAIKFYNRAMSFAYNEEYVDTINNRAEAGINQLQE